MRRDVARNKVIYIEASSKHCITGGVAKAAAAAAAAGRRRRRREEKLAC